MPQFKPQNIINIGDTLMIKNKQLIISVFIFIFLPLNASALSKDENCVNISAQWSFFNMLGRAVTKQVSDRDGCHAAFIADIYDYQRPISSRVFDAVSYDVRVKSRSKTSCERNRIGVLAWKKNGKYLGGKWVWGKWNTRSKFCVMPLVTLSSIGVRKSGEDYRLAVTARRYNKPKNHRYGYRMKKVSFLRTGLPIVK